MVIPVSLTLPGLINNINPDIHVGFVTRRLFDISYVLGVSVFSFSNDLTLIITGLPSLSWHQPYTSHSRLFSPPTIQCSTTSLSGRRCSLTTGVIAIATHRGRPKLRKQRSLNYSWLGIHYTTSSASVLSVKCHRCFQWCPRRRNLTPVWRFFLFSLKHKTANTSKANLCLLPYPSGR